MASANNSNRAATRHTQQVIAVTDVQADRFKKLMAKFREVDMFDTVDKVLELAEAYDWKPDEQQ